MRYSTMIRGGMALVLLAALGTRAEAQGTGGGGLTGGSTGAGNDNTGYGTTSAEFLLLGAGARGTALGGAFAALANDASALYYNPGAAALVSRPGVMLSTYDYVADTRYSWGGLVLPFSSGQRAFGVQLGTFGFKDQPVYTADQPEGTGARYSVNETFAGASFAQNFSDRFSAGLTAKFIFDQLGDVDGKAFAVDFGTSFHAALNNHPIRFSFTLQNLGTNVSYSGTGIQGDIPRVPLPGEPPVPNTPQPAEFQTKDFPLPTMFRIALAYDLLPRENSRLSILGEFNQATSNKAGFTGAAEYAASHLGGSGFGFALRGSYSFAPANNITLSNPSQTALSDEENLQGLAFGGGLNYATGNFNLGVDYAYKYMGILGPTNFFSLSLGW
ncbi:MAG TPA: PorV/PorQ family protein [Gemmatimonadales bacterium]|nr:PorV/PorQ family protein [Gemmatimonadales bacterium]